MRPRTLALGGLKWVAAGVDVLRSRPNGVTVLAYHRVGARSSIENDLPRSLFLRHLEELQAGDRIVELGPALRALTSGRPLPQSDPVVLSFDDGTSDFSEVVLPLLAAFRMPATLYLATDFVEQGVSFPHGGRPLSWAALRDIVATGLVTIGSHTHTHALLDRVGPKHAAEELDRSIGLIEDRLGVTPHDFAYPKAVPATGAVEHEVRRRFRSAALYGNRSNQYGATDLHRLARSPIQRADAMRWFRRKTAGGMAFEDAIRRASWRIRYSRRAS